MQGQAYTFQILTQFIKMNTSLVQIGCPTLVDMGKATLGKNSLYKGKQTIKTYVTQQTRNSNKEGRSQTRPQMV